MEGEFSGRSPFPSGPLLIPFGAGEKFDTGRLGTQWKIDGPQTGGRFSVVHHQLPPRTLAAPLHRHHREDEHSYVLTGTFGALLGDDVVTAEPGTWVVAYILERGRHSVRNHRSNLTRRFRRLLSRIASNLARQNQGCPAASKI
jgi:mannose-6-phosphate isomerase-like protein (cupin superfamily)